MNQNYINTIGRKQAPREEALLFCLNQVEGLIEILDNDFPEWTNFDRWKNIRFQQWIFARSIDAYKGKKIDIKCECCEYINLTQRDSNKISDLKCYGIKSAYMIEKVLDEILLAKVRRESDGTYSA